MTSPAQQRAAHADAMAAASRAADQMLRDVRQREVDAARLARLADPDIEKRARARMDPKGRWSQLAEQAAEQQTSIAEQRRTEQAAQAADKAEAAWVLRQAAARQQRDRQSAEAAAGQLREVLKEIHDLRSEAEARKLSEKDIAARLGKLRREQDRLTTLAESLTVGVATTKAMREDPAAYLASMLQRYPSLNTGHPLGDSDDGGEPPASLPPDVGRLHSLLESVREAFVEAEDAYLAVADRQRRLAGLAAIEGESLATKYPALEGRAR